MTKKTKPKKLIEGRLIIPNEETEKTENIPKSEHNHCNRCGFDFDEPILRNNIKCCPECLAPIAWES